MLANVDGRTADARRYRDLVISFADDLGGVDKLTEAEKAICRQAAGAVVASEKLQAKMIAGDVVDLEQASRAANIASRFLNQLRIRQRPAKAPTLAEYAAGKAARRTAAE